MTAYNRIAAMYLSLRVLVNVATKWIVALWQWPLKIILSYT